jgi:hypothetical protein
MTSGLDKWCACGGGKGRGDSISLLVVIDLSVPLSPDLEWSEHATLTAHVSESTLA